jgi:hypothetical protein
MVDNAGLTVFLLETEKPLFISDWAAELHKQAVKKAASQKQAKASKL